MTMYCPENERVKRRYLLFLREVKGYSEATIDIAMAAIHRFEVHTKHRDFRKFHIEQASSFKRSLCAPRKGKDGLSSATIQATLRAVKAFFVWLADQPGYRSRIRYADAAYFTPLAKDQHIAAARRERPGPSIEEVERVLKAMPATSDIELRDRALIAFTLLTGARDRAIASFSLEYVDLEKGAVFQDARKVKTKRSKTFWTKFFPVGSLAESIVCDWVRHLVNKGWRPCDPLFPATVMVQDDNQHFRAAGLSRTHWETTTSIRKVFRNAFALAGLPYHNPHSFRSTLARLGEKLCRTAEDMKSWSQNLGHDRVLTTLTSYGTVPQERQFEVICQLGVERPDAEATLEQIRRFVAVKPGS